MGALLVSERVAADDARGSHPRSVTRCTVTFARRLRASAPKHQASPSYPTPFIRRTDPTDGMRHVFVVPILFASTAFSGSSRYAARERGLARRGDENENVVAAINRLRRARGAPETSLGEIVDGNLANGAADQVIGGDLIGSLSVQP